MKWLWCLIVFFVAVNATGPLLYFSDIVNGQNKGNSDTSKGQTTGQHGAFVTLYGVNLGSTQGIKYLILFVYLLIIRLRNKQGIYWRRWGSLLLPMEQCRFPC